MKAREWFLHVPIQNAEHTKSIEMQTSKEVKYNIELSV